MDNKHKTCSKNPNNKTQTLSNPKRRWLSDKITMSFIGGCVGRASLSWRSGVLGFVSLSWVTLVDLVVKGWVQTTRLAEKIQADNLNRNDWLGRDSLFQLREMGLGVELSLFGSCSFMFFWKVRLSFCGGGLGEPLRVDRGLGLFFVSLDPWSCSWELG